MLTYVRIRRFGCCEHTVLALDAPVVALVGRNGTGKTTILRAIEWIARAGTSQTGGLPLDSHGPSEATLTFRVHDRQYQYTIKYSGIDEAGDARTQRYEKLTFLPCGGNDKTQVLFTRRGERIVSDAYGVRLRVGWRSPSLYAIVSLLPKEDPLHQAVIKAYDYLRRIAYYPLEETEHDRAQLVAERDFVRWRKEYKSESRSGRSALFRIIHMWQSDPDLFSELKSLVGPDGLGLLDDIHIAGIPVASISNGTSAVEESTEPEYYYALFFPGKKLGGHGSGFPYSALSAGTRRILRLVTYLLFDQRSVMLMEQPEDCVHPGLLHKLLGILRGYSERCQLIFTTHSPEVLNSLQPGEIRLVESRDGCAHGRALAPREKKTAERYLKEEGSLGDYIDSLDED